MIKNHLLDRGNWNGGRQELCDRGPFPPAEKSLESRSHEIIMSLAPTTEELPEGWEAVQDDQGRTYFWNVDTNEVMWTRPVVVRATKGIAASACRVLCQFTPGCLLSTFHRRSQGTSRL